MFKTLTAKQLGPVVDEVFGLLSARDFEELNTRLAKIRDEITVINMHLVAMYLRSSYSYRDQLNAWDDLLVTAVRESIKSDYPVTDLFYGLWKVDHPLYQDLFKGTPWASTQEPSAQS